MPIEPKNKHYNALIDNVKEVDRLQEIHSQITTPGPGRKYDVQVLHKSAIVLLVACWEAYVEDLVAAILKEMIAAADDYTVFPKIVLERVGSQHSGPKAWDLAGDGWKQALKDNLKEVLAKTTGTLNTPRTEQVDELFNKTIGLSSPSSSWYWPGRSAKQAAKALDELITLRGSIAHRVSVARSVTLEDVRDARNLIRRLAAKTHNRVCGYLKERIGKSPWKTVKFKGTR
jgi:hypothetical protein